jgi:hydroxyacylglutathione hydrolase
MMQIEQFRYGADNLGYLVYSGNIGIAIDPGAVSKMVGFAKAHQITIDRVTNTHCHPDHTSGNGQMLEMTGANFIDCRDLTDGQQLALGPETLEVVATPGHTHDDICFTADDFLVTGDTLFNGTVGNCFSGDLEAFYLSLKKLMAFPGTTRIFAGHDYVKESLEIAAAIDPENSDIDPCLEKYHPDLVFSTLEDEMRVNPFLRFNSKRMIQKLKERQFPCDSEKQRFISVMKAF